MDLKNALAELGNKLGIGAIELDQDDGCQLAFDEELIVDIEIIDDEPGFFMSAVVGDAPRERREIVFAELLEANLQGRGTGRCCFALDRDLDEIVLSKHYDRDEIESGTLDEELEYFLQVLAFWRQRHAEGLLGSIRGTEIQDGASPQEWDGMIRP